MKLLLHNPLGPICTAARLHLDIACPNAGPQEVVFPPATMLPDVFECAFKLEDIRLTLPTAPGLGIHFNREAAERHPADMTEPPHLHQHAMDHTQTTDQPKGAQYGAAVSRDYPGCSNAV